MLFRLLCFVFLICAFSSAQIGDVTDTAGIKNIGDPGEPLRYFPDISSGPNLGFRLDPNLVWGFRFDSDVPEHQLSQFGYGKTHFRPGYYSYSEATTSAGWVTIRNDPDVPAGYSGTSLALVSSPKSGNQYSFVQSGYIQDLLTDAGTTNWTLVFWFKHDEGFSFNSFDIGLEPLDRSDDGYSNVLGGNAGDIHPSLERGISLTQFQPVISDTQTTPFVGDMGPSAFVDIPVGAWRHIALIHDGANATTKTYTNAVFSGSATISINAGWDRYIGLQTAASADGVSIATNYFDEIGFFDDVLTEPELQEIVNNGLWGDLGAGDGDPANEVAFTYNIEDETVKAYAWTFDELDMQTNGVTASVGGLDFTFGGTYALGFSGGTNYVRHVDLRPGTKTNWVSGTLFFDPTSGKLSNLQSAETSSLFDSDDSDWTMGGWFEMEVGNNVTWDLITISNVTHGAVDARIRQFSSAGATFQFISNLGATTTHTVYASGNQTNWRHYAVTKSSTNYVVYFMGAKMFDDFKFAPTDPVSEWSQSGTYTNAYATDTYAFHVRSPTGFGLWVDELFCIGRALEPWEIFSIYRKGLRANYGAAVNDDSD